MSKSVVEKIVISAYEEEIRALKKLLKAKDKENKLLKKKIENGGKEKKTKVKKVVKKSDKIAELKEKFRKEYSGGKL